MRENNARQSLLQLQSAVLRLTGEQQKADQLKRESEDAATRKAAAEKSAEAFRFEAALAKAAAAGEHETVVKLRQQLDAAQKASSEAQQRAASAQPLAAFPTSNQTIINQLGEAYATQQSQIRAAGRANEQLNAQFQQDQNRSARSSTAAGSARPPGPVTPTITQGADLLDNISPISLVPVASGMEVLDSESNRLLKIELRDGSANVTNMQPLPSSAYLLAAASARFNGRDFAFVSMILEGRGVLERYPRLGQNNVYWIAPRQLSFWRWLSTFPPSRFMR